MGEGGPAGGSVPTAAAKLSQYVWLERHKRALVTQGRTSEVALAQPGLGAVAAAADGLRLSTLTSVTSQLIDGINTSTLIVSNPNPNLRP